MVQNFVHSRCWVWNYHRLGIDIETQENEQNNGGRCQLQERNISSFEATKQASWKQLL